MIQKPLHFNEIENKQIEHELQRFTKSNIIERVLIRKTMSLSLIF